MSDEQQTNLTTIARDEVIAAAKTWHSVWRELPEGEGRRAEEGRQRRLNDAACELLAAVSLLKERERADKFLMGKSAQQAMESTKRLDVEA